MSLTLATSPNDLTALHQRGFARLALQSYTDALADFEKEIDLDPIFPDAWLGKALALIGLDRKVEAREALDMAIFLDPNYIDAIQAKELLGD